MRAYSVFTRTSRTSRNTPELIESYRVPSPINSTRTGRNKRGVRVFCPSCANGTEPTRNASTPSIYNIVRLVPSCPGKKRVEA